MAISYTGKTGKSYTIIEPALGKGGEGAVYKISGMPNYVLKVFNDKHRTESRHRKLLVMIGTKLPSAAMQQITWPIDVVYQGSQFVGYVMPAIKDNEELNVIYSDKYVTTLAERIIVAKNLCAAINSVHNAGQVCGDLNPKNIVVDPNTYRLTLVDTDSYHITDPQSSRTYRCEVGRPEYLAREIQEKLKSGSKSGLTLATIPAPTFTKYTDLFALAVHIFALLMNGCHPFACAGNGKTNIGSMAASKPSVATPQPVENILDGFFPFYTQKSGFTIPRYAPEFDSLPQNIRDLFIRAFVNGHKDPTQRPDAVEWYNALTVYENNLTTCKKKHMYSSHLSKCVWCELENKPLPVQEKHVTVTPATTTTATTTGTYTPSYTHNTSSHSKYKPFMQRGFMFWLLTILLGLGVQFLIQQRWGDTIIAGCFGTSIRSGLKYWGRNLAIRIGPWGFIAGAFIGTLIYNIKWSIGGRLNGYKWYHYLLSVVTSVVCSGLYILLVYIISFAIIAIAVILVLFFAYAILSGG